MHVQAEWPSPYDEAICGPGKWVHFEMSSASPDPRMHCPGLARKQITGEGHVSFLLRVSPLVHNYVFQLREPQPSSGCKSSHVFWNCWGNAPRILNRKGFSASLSETIAVRDWEGRKRFGWNLEAGMEITRPKPLFPAAETGAQGAEVIGPGYPVRQQQHLHRSPRCPTPRPRQLLLPLVFLSQPTYPGN